MEQKTEFKPTRERISDLEEALNELLEQTRDVEWDELVSTDGLTDLIYDELIYGSTGDRFREGIVESVWEELPDYSDRLDVIDERLDVIETYLREVRGDGPMPDLPGHW